MTNAAKLNKHELDPISDQIKLAGYLGLGTIAETLEAISSVSLFLQLLKEKSYLAQYSTHHVQTLFAPTNEAIKKLALKKQQLLEQSSEVFAKLLDQLSSTQFLLMGGRSPQEPKSMPAVSKYIRIPNIPARNGVIHIIDDLKSIRIGV